MRGVRCPLSGVRCPNGFVGYGVPGRPWSVVRGPLSEWVRGIRGSGEAVVSGGIEAPPGAGRA